MITYKPNQWSSLERLRELMQMYVVVFFKLNVNLTFRSAYLTSGNNVIGMQQQRRWSGLNTKHLEMFHFRTLWLGTVSII